MVPGEKNCIIREARQRDYQEIFQLTEAAFEKYEQKIEQADTGHLQETAADIKTDIQNQLVLILEKQEKILGSLRLRAVTAEEERQLLVNTGNEQRTGDNRSVINNTGKEETGSEKTGGKVFLLRRFAINPANQGQGYGSLLFSAAEKRVQAAGGIRIYLYSSLDNDRLSTFYRNNGFCCQLVDESRGYRRGLWKKEL